MSIENIIYLEGLITGAVFITGLWSMICLGFSREFRNHTAGNRALKQILMMGPFIWVAALIICLWLIWGRQAKRFYEAMK